MFVMALEKNTIYFSPAGSGSLLRVRDNVLGALHSGAFTAEAGPV